VCPTFETRAARRRRRLSAYHQPWRRSIASLTACAPTLEDLAESFPALLFALATGYATAAERARAIARVEAGFPLKAAAEALGLPLWLRRFPPQALTVPLPAIPRDGEFAAAIASRVPLDAEEAALWFGRIALALRTVGRDFAIWISKGPRLLPISETREDFQWLVAWAWHSQHPGTRAHGLLRRPWTPAVSWKKARDEVAIWRKRIDLAAILGRGIRDVWFVDGRALGLDIVALRTVEDFLAESVAMENCLDQYAPQMAYGRVRVFSVRRNGRSIANLELSLRSDDATMPCISQLRGPRNRRVSTQVWQAVHAWMGGQPFKSLASEPSSPADAGETLRYLWQPFAQALQGTELERQFRPRVFGPMLPGRESGMSLPRIGTIDRLTRPATRSRAGMAARRVEEHQRS
jgi:hypothetical protein